MLFVLAFATVGALVASRRPRNAIGWLLLLAGLSYVIGGLSETAGADQSALVAWVGEWIWLVGIGPVATFGLLLFPNGRLPSRRWRPVAWLAAAGLVVSVGAVAFKPGQLRGLDDREPARDPVAARLGGDGGALRPAGGACGLDRLASSPVTAPPARSSGGS